MNDQENNEDMNKSVKIIAGIVIAAGASIAIVGGAYAYNKSNSTPQEAKIVTSSQISSSSSRKASSSSDKSSAEASRASSISAENSTSASLSMQAQAEAAAKAAEEAKKAEEARIAAEQQAAAQAQAEAEAQARAAQEAQQKTKEDDTPAWKQPATYDEPSYEPDPEPEPEPTPSQGGGNGGSWGETIEAEQAAERARLEESFKEYAAKEWPGQDAHIATEEDLEKWGL